MIRLLALVGVTLAVGIKPVQAALSPDQLARLPPAATRPVDFARDIQPLFEASCVQCHARGKSKGGFSLETREDFLSGGDTGPSTVPGRSATSLIIESISGLNADLVMPKKGKKLTGDQIAVFRAWIDQGMPWPEKITFQKHEPANLRARELETISVRPEFPNPVDGMVDAVFTRAGFAWPHPVDDRTYARRVWLDVVGVLPPPEELAAFRLDSAPDKRAQLVRRLLADNQRYAEHWLTFWSDMLRNDYKGTGYIDGGRKPITAWLYRALARNLPYDRFVAELINPGVEAEGFTKGIVWRGAVNASMVPPMQAAQGVAQVFLGVNLKCTSCHDSFINEYTLKDAYGLAGVYADGPLEIAECDRPTGRVGKVKFLYEELGVIDPAADARTRKARLAAIITARSNGRLTRTIVNRLWQRFMGYGLVEPVDEMDKPAWSPELMDWLAEDLAAHGYDLKQTMARILTSRAYQLPAVNVREGEENYVFRGPAVRRLSAEQFSDAVMALTRSTHARANAKANRNAALSGAVAAVAVPPPRWIWSTPGAEVRAEAGSVVFRRTLVLPAKPTDAVLTLAADDSYAVVINGKNAATSGRRNSTMMESFEVKALLKEGENTIVVTVTNLAREEAPVGLVDNSGAEAGTPAGLILYARVRADERVMDFVSDSAWTFASGKESRAAIELGEAELAPWRLGPAFLELALAPKDTLPVERASLVAADPLMVALGRPNREQVVTVRLGAANTLQALELTNGVTLAAWLTQGAGKIVAASPADPGALVDSLYLQAIGRKPNAAERGVALQSLGSPATTEGVADLLWAILMLPEFQLIF